MHKHLARTLRADLAEIGHPVPLARSLELTAALCGAKDWNTLKARPTPLLPLEAAKAALIARLAQEGVRLTPEQVKTLADRMEAAAQEHSPDPGEDPFTSGGWIYVSNGAEFPSTEAAAMPITAALLRRKIDQAFAEHGLLPERPDEHRAPPRLPAWPFGAHVGARVMLENGWHQQGTAVIVAISGQGPDTTYTLQFGDREGQGHQTTYHRNGREVGRTSMDESEPRFVLPLRPDARSHPLQDAPP